MLLHTAPYTFLCCGRLACCLAAQTHYEVVVINEAQERCRDAIYSDVAGPRVPKAIHLSGSSWTNGRNGTRIASHYTNRR